MKYLRLFEEIDISPYNIDALSLLKVVVLIPKVEELFYDLIDTGFKVNIDHVRLNDRYIVDQNGDVAISVSISKFIGKPVAFNIDEIKENILFAKSYAESELGLETVAISYRDHFGSHNFYHPNMESLKHIKISYFNIKFKIK